jgi:hypothetical protein
MNKALVAVGVLCLLGSVLWADDYYSSFKLGIQASATPIQTQYGVDSDYLDGAEMYPQVTLGATLHVLPWLVLSPGVILSNQETSYQDTYASASAYTEDTNLYLGGGADLLFFLGSGQLSIFLGSGFWYGSLNYQGFNSSGNLSRSETYTAMTIPVIVGAQFMLSRNFAFYFRTGVDVFLVTYEYANYNATTGAISSGTHHDETYALVHAPTFGLTYYFN